MRLETKNVIKRICALFCTIVLLVHSGIFTISAINEDALESRIHGGRLSCLKNGDSNLNYSFSNANNYTNYYGISYLSCAQNALFGSNDSWVSESNITRISLSSVADAEIRFSFIYSEGALYSNSYAGVRYCNEVGTFLNPDSLFEAYPPSPNNSTYLFAIVFINQCYAQYLSSPGGMQAICAHEVGHIFSLSHPGEDSDSIMYAATYSNYLNGGPLGPAPIDVTTVHNTYPLI